MSNPFVYVKVSPLKYYVTRSYNKEVYNFGSIELSYRTWIFIPNSDGVPYLFGNELVNIGRKMLSLNKAARQ